MFMSLSLSLISLSAVGGSPPPFPRAPSGALLRVLPKMSYLDLFLGHLGAMRVIHAFAEMAILYALNTCNPQSVTFLAGRGEICPPHG